jgi:hypothetical protein
MRRGNVEPLLAKLAGTVSSFAWWIICKSSTLWILVSCSSKAPLTLLDLSIFAILEIQNQKNYCSKIHLGFENCTHKKRTVEKRPKQLLIVRLADKRQEEIRGCGAAAFRMKKREERECKKLGFHEQFQQGGIAHSSCCCTNTPQ